MQFAITHPHAKTAVSLAALDHPQRGHVNLVLRETRTPRSLYTLARVLRAAQLVDEMQAADLRRSLDAKHAADSAAILGRLAAVSATA